MKNSILLFVLLAATQLSAQEITNFILIGPKGVTEDVKKAESFIVIKRYPDHFERLDYKMLGPLVKSRSYTDSTLKVQSGKYYEYQPNGRILYAGNFSDNKKSGSWFTYNDSGKVIRSEKFENDVLVEVVDLNKKDSSKKFDDERDAEFPGGVKGWIRYLGKSLEKSEAAANAKKGGHVIVGFVVDTDGKVQEAYLAKSENFALDENSLSIITKSPKWKTAWQNGHAVKGFLLQPILYAPAQ
jgi:antitoxin component YwqK of YwqJK toxin-antitoxin module